MAYARVLFEELHLNSSFTIEWISENELISTPWEKTAKAIVIPGGRDVYYHEALQTLGNKKIIDFVTKGGSFLGICAGAYYGASSIEFDVNHPLEVIGKRELQFFPGIARGPAYGYGTFTYQNESSGRVSSLQLKDGSLLSSYYNGGCYFQDAHLFDNVEILATYHDIKESPAAIVQCSFGLGNAVLCGTHPEISSENLAMNDPFFETFKPHLQSVEKERKQLLSFILDKLLNYHNSA